VRTSAAERVELAPEAPVSDAHGLLKWRAAALAAGYKPRPVDAARQTAGLEALGYF
jgi:hypothetical protein